MIPYSNQLTNKSKLKEKEKITSFQDAYNKYKRNRICKIINQPESILHSITFSNNKLRKWTHKGRRVGGPRLNWVQETVEELWNHIKKDDINTRYEPFNENKSIIMDAIKHYATENQRENNKRKRK